MKRIASLILKTALASTFFASAHAKNKTFMPENELWKEDKVYFFSNEGEKTFKEIIAIGKKLYEPIAKSMEEELIINPLWTNPTVNADATRTWNNQAIINMYGGLFRRKEITKGGFALILCHELNHTYGWYPYIYSPLWISAEGQADYGGAKYCLKNVLSKMKDDDPVASPFIQKTCKKNRLCERALMAGESTANLLNLGVNELNVNYQTPDKTVVKKTLTSYPDTIQCRLDTYLHGIMQLNRPKCWFNR